MIEHLLLAARWAPSASNRRIQKFVVICDPSTIALVKLLSPGMLGNPQALILICNDYLKAEIMGVKIGRDRTNWIDVGAAAQNIMLAAQEVGLASSPATSFSKRGIRTLLDLPEHLMPEYFVQLGYPAPQAPRKLREGVSTRLPLADLVYWNDQMTRQGEDC